MSSAQLDPTLRIRLSTALLARRRAITRRARPIRRSSRAWPMLFFRRRRIRWRPRRFPLALPVTAPISRCARAFLGHHGRALCAARSPFGPPDLPPTTIPSVVPTPNISRAFGAVLRCNRHASARPSRRSATGRLRGSAGPSFSTDIDYCAIPRFLGDATALFRLPTRRRPMQAMIRPRHPAARRPRGRTISISCMTERRRRRIRRPRPQPRATDAIASCVYSAICGAANAPNLRCACRFVLRQRTSRFPARRRPTRIGSPTPLRWRRLSRPFHAAAMTAMPRPARGSGRSDALYFVPCRRAFAAHRDRAGPARAIDRRPATRPTRELDSAARPSIPIA